MNLLLAINLGLAPVPPRPIIPDGIVRRCADPDKYRREPLSEVSSTAERRDRIADFLRVHPPISAGELRGFAGVSMSTLNADLLALSRRGLIVPAGWGGQTGRARLWSASDAPTC